MDYIVRNFLEKLMKDSRVSGSAVSKTVKIKIQGLRDAGFIGWEKSGRGGVFVAKKPDGIKKLLGATGYHGPAGHLTPKAKAVGMHGDAHAGKDDTLIFHLSAIRTVLWYNHGRAVDLSKIIDECGMASIVVRPKDKWTTPHPIALVENLDLIVYADTYFKHIPFKGNILYYAGWVSRKALEWLKQQEYPPKIIFPDYDTVGLNNYLKLKNIFPDIKLYIPDHLEELIKRFGNAGRLKEQVEKGYRVNPGTDKDAGRVLDLIEKYGQCLDQESILFAVDEETSYKIQGS